jgi:epoxyqueuosine reductase
MSVRRGRTRTFSPVVRGISKRSYRQTSREVCPWNQRFASALPDESPYQRREALAEQDARQLTRKLLTMSQEECSRAFRTSPTKRAKLRGLKRNASVVLGNVGTADDVGLLERARDEELDGMVREHVARALARLTR